MKKLIIILFCIFICFLTGFVSSRFQTESIINWYPLLNKSSLSPPNYAFPIAWSFLYLCMGISFGLIINNYSKERSFLIRLFIIQLILNFSWSIVFFYFQNPLLGLINILLLEILITYYAVKSYSAVKVSSLLFIPYILWVGFASYLNLYILLNN